MHCTVHPRGAGGAIAALALAATTTLTTTASAAVEITVTIENLAPADGNWLTPVWGGFHDGGYDLFDPGSAASPGLERIAEDGNAMVLREEFGAGAPSGVDGMIGGAPIAPGDVVTQTFTVDAANRFFSYASMVLPSNDAFVGNADAMGVAVFGEDGTFTGADFFLTGDMVWDAGTEVNDELPENTAFFGQAAPDTGVPEGGVVALHPGFLGSLGNPGTPSILGDPQFAGADFTIPGYPIARVTIVPAPGALALLGLAGLAGPRRRRG
jgi:hypothetical protein